MNKLRRLSELGSLYRLSPNLDLESIELRKIINSILFTNIDRGEAYFKPLDGHKSKQPQSFWQIGWAVGYTMRESEDSYSCYILHPNLIGYYEKENVSNMEISNAIEEALDFCINPYC